MNTVASGAFSRRGSRGWPRLLACACAALTSVGAVPATRAQPDRPLTIEQVLRSTAAHHPSVQAALARSTIAPYTATKGAVSNLTKGMATDWAKYGLQCNAIAPGYVETPLNAALIADRIDPADQRGLLADM